MPKSAAQGSSREEMMADQKAAALLPVELGPGKVRFARGIKAGAVGVRHRADGAGFRDRHRAGRAGGAHAAWRASEAREGSQAYLREPRCGVEGRRHRPQQSGSHRPVLHDREGGSALSVGAARAPQRPHPAVDLDRAAGIAAAGRRHEHPGDGASCRGPASRSTHLKHKQLEGRPTSGYSPALTVGDFIFIPYITSLAVGDEPAPLERRG